jgi:hypothetical protein
MSIDFEPQEEDFELEDATEVFSFQAPSTHNLNLDVFDVLPALRLRDFHRPLKPVYLAASSVRRWLLHNDFKTCSLQCLIPFDIEKRLFLLPPELKYLAEPISDLITRTEEIDLLKNVFALNAVAVNHFVPWGESMLANAWHIDEEVFYNSLKDTYCVNTEDARQNLIYVAHSYPFSTQFHETMSAHEASLLNYPAKDPLPEVERMKQLWLDRDHPSTEPPRGHTYAWTPAHVHRSPLMPTSKEECLVLLRDEDPDLVKKIVSEDGVMRTFIRLAVGRYHPSLQQ